MNEELPEGWIQVQLGDVCEPVSQRGPGKERKVFRYIDLGAIDNKSRRVADTSLIPIADAPSRAKQIVQGGDIVFSTVRVYLENIAAVPDELDGEIASTAFCVLRPAPGIESRYLYHYVTSRSFVLAVNQLSRGNSPPSVQDGDIRSRHLPLAPPQEQKRIASRIDELFSRIEEGEKALEKVQKLVERYRQSVLKAAVTGELTRAWREKNKSKPESGATLLARILKARRAAWEKAELAKMKAKGQKPANDKWKQKYEEPSSPDTTDLPELPEGWVWVSVEQLCFVDTGATPKRGTERYFKDGTIDWITSTAVNESVIRSAGERITPAAIRETNAKVFPVGSLIVAMYGEGKTRGKVSELGIAAATNQACAALLCGHLDLAVKAHMRTFFEKNYAALRSEAAGGVQPNLNLAIIKGTSLPLPPSAEIAAINEVVVTRLTQVAAFVAEFPTWSKQSVALKQKILGYAFSGALTERDPNDEPATVLLKRITSQRGTATPAKPKRDTKKKNQAA